MLDIGFQLSGGRSSLRSVANFCACAVAFMGVAAGTALAEEPATILGPKTVDMVLVPPVGGWTGGQAWRNFAYLSLTFTCSESTSLIDNKQTTWYTYNYQLSNPLLLKNGATNPIENSIDYLYLSLSQAPTQAADKQVTSTNWASDEFKIGTTSPTGWQCSYPVYSHEDFRYKIHWYTPYDAYALSPEKTLAFSFKSLDGPSVVPNIIVSAQYGTQYAQDPSSDGFTYGPNVAPVPEPSTFLSALSILGSVGLFGRRVFRK